MKIRNESEYVAATFQSISNWNDIQIGTERVSKPNKLFGNDELRDGLTAVSYTTFKEFYSKHVVFNLWDNCCCCCCQNESNSCDAAQAAHCIKSGTFKVRRAEKNLRLATTFFSYILYKLTQLCFVILLLVPFLLTCNTLIQQVSGQDVVKVPISMPISNSNLELDHNMFRAQLDPSHVQLRGAQSKRDCQMRLDDNRSYHTKVHSIIKSKSRIYSSIHRLRGYSVIVLSQSDNNRNSGKKSLNKSLDAPKSAVMANGSSIRRTKRNVHIAKNEQAREIKRKPDADSQKLEVAFEKYKENNHMYNRIINKEKLTKLIMKGLGLKKLPDMKKANISQLEYSSKYLEYLERLRTNHGVKNVMDSLYLSSGPPATTLQILSIVTNRFNDITQSRIRQRRAPSTAKNRERKTFKRGNEFGTNILLHFPLAINNADFHYEKLDEANVRLMMLYNPALAAQSQHRTRLETGNRRNPMRSKGGCDTGEAHHPHISAKPRPKIRSHILNLKVYQLLPMHKRRQLDARQIEFENPNFGSLNEETRSQWLEFDVTDAVRGWLNKSHENLGIEIQCDKCRRIGARILSDVATPTSHLLKETAEEDRFHLAPVLNIIGHIGRTHREQGVQSFGAANNHSSSQFFHHDNNRNQVKMWPNSCYKTHQRCCRHQLDVAFKDIKGFEFIIQPKVFDAGYCRGRCPPRHNPAHHHALLQSLIWQKDHNRAPRPCCAPSKLTELEILHVDEEHSDKLKISTWSDMQVLECACS
ncbi:uncharacterized protein mav [Drosophila virilis]|uniref:TGF-beta family profile domain-containing protein n=1 Tax=Drosophila virilis TaxID=7244 RepID=B4MF20_DROVI|nr:uncharacterized protein LOC6636254 [Drosophila virilis]ACY70488.1 hypothetical protein DVIR88_6g0025 [Drosophila virilis]EDW71121.2 uncharacterized protein Dvir_GJ14763 [Drosophila virilis]